MVSEEIVLDRDRVELLVSELSGMLKVESHYQFKLRFSEKDGERTLAIIPHARPVEITLSRS